MRTVEVPEFRKNDREREILPVGRVGEWTGRGKKEDREIGALGKRRKKKEGREDTKGQREDREIGTLEKRRKKKERRGEDTKGQGEDREIITLKKEEEEKKQELRSFRSFQISNQLI